MRIIITNFGPIKEFVYDLDKEMIVTYGNNNIGKSYAMQIVYLLLKAFNGEIYVAQRMFSRIYLYSRTSDVPKHKENVKNMVYQFIESEEQIKDITTYISREVDELISASFMPEFMNSCKNTFGNLEKTLQNNPKIVIKCEEYEFLLD